LIWLIEGNAVQNIGVVDEGQKKVIDKLRVIKGEGLNLIAIPN
jgi:hypothetical protein